MRILNAPRSACTTIAPTRSPVPAEPCFHSSACPAPASPHAPLVQIVPPLLRAARSARAVISHMAHFSSRGLGDRGRKPDQEMRKCKERQHAIDKGAQHTAHGNNLKKQRAPRNNANGPLSLARSFEATPVDLVPPRAPRRVVAREFDDGNERRPAVCALEREARLRELRHERLALLGREDWRRTFSDEPRGNRVKRDATRETHRR